MQYKVMDRAWRSFTEAYAQSLSVNNCNLDLATWFLHATLCLVRIIICAKLISNPTIQDKVQSWTWIWNAYTYTNTGKTVYALPPFYGGGIIFFLLHKEIIKLRKSVKVGNFHTYFTFKCLSFDRNLQSWTFWIFYTDFYEVFSKFNCPSSSTISTQFIFCWVLSLKTKLKLLGNYFFFISNVSTQLSYVVNSED